MRWQHLGFCAGAGRNSAGGLRIDGPVKHIRKNKILIEMEQEYKKSLYATSLLPSLMCCKSIETRPLCLAYL